MISGEPLRCRNGDIVRFYAEDSEIARKYFPANCTPVLDTDTEYITYIDRIKSAGQLIKTETNGCSCRELYKILYNNGYILAQLRADKRDGNYYDLVMFQRRDNIGYTFPILWDIATCREFCDRFIKQQTKLPCGFTVSMRELNKLKAVKFYNKNGVCYWFDSDGYFYYANKYSLPTRKAKAEYDRLHDNPHALLVKWKCPTMEDPYAHGLQWFESAKEFADWWSEAAAAAPSWAETPSYIIKCGYTALPCEDRKVIFRCPFYDVDEELKQGITAEKIAFDWSRSCSNKYIVVGDEYTKELAGMTMRTTYEDIIKQYIKYKAQTAN